MFRNKTSIEDKKDIKSTIKYANNVCTRILIINAFKEILSINTNEKAWKLFTSSIKISNRKILLDRKKVVFF